MRTGTKTRHIRSTGRALFETDKGPLVVLDRSGADGYDANPSLVAPGGYTRVGISNHTSQATCDQSGCFFLFGEALSLQERSLGQDSLLDFPVQFLVKTQSVQNANFCLGFQITNDQF